MAVPNPQNELARVDKALRKPLPPIVLLMGPSDFFRQQALERLLTVIPKDAELRQVDGSDTKEASASDDGGAGGGGGAGGSGSELLDLRGGGLFARTAFVVVRRGANWWKKHGASVAELAPSIAPGCGLIVESPKLEKRKRAVAALVKQTQQDGSLYEFRDLYDMPYERARGPLEGELCRWVVHASKERKVPLQPETAWLMIAQVGKSPAELVAELDRLQARYDGEKVTAPLSPKELAGKLTVSFSSDPFEFTEAVLSGDRAAASRSLTAMFARGVRQQDGRTMDSGGLLPFTTSWLFRQMCATYEGRQLYERGTSLRDVAQQLGVRAFVDRFTDQVKHNDLARLQRGIAALHSCQRLSRTRGEEPDVLLERFLSQWFDGAPIETAEEMEL
ncbi:MAG: DNA polymerase III subunit delta [Planctomycetota bacterium]